jgi:hypothetical protein
MKIRCLVLASALISSPAFAMLCPGNFNTINVGDTLESVIQQCGKPDSYKTYDSTADAPQEWNYYVQVPSQLYGTIGSSGQASLKTTVGFAEGKVSNISVNGIGVSTTAICGGTIQIGDTQDAVQKTCGKPQFINTGNGAQQGSQNNGPAAKMVDLTYTGGSGAIFVFKNNVLIQRK